MIGTILRDEKGEVQTLRSGYFPKESIRNLILQVQEDYRLGEKNHTTVLRELNDMTILQRQTETQKAYNSYVPPKDPNPEHGWRSRAVRPTARDKVIGTAAHLLSHLLYGKAFAQNDMDEEDVDAEEVFEILMKYAYEQGEYEYKMMLAVIALLVNPLVVVQTDWNNAFAFRWDGEKLVKTPDPDNSGWNMTLAPLEDFFFANLYQADIQKQRFLGRKRYIEYDEAKRLWGDNPDFKFVLPGQMTFWDSAGNTFYLQFDNTNPTQVEEFTYYNKNEDREVVFVGGVLVTDENRRIRHRTSNDLPKYNFAVQYFETLDEGRLICGKSLVDKVGGNYELLNTFYRIVSDALVLEVIKPIILTGGNKFGGNIMYPGRTTHIKEGLGTPIGMNSNFGAVFTHIQNIEKTISESSQDQLRSGVVEGTGGRTAREVMLAEKNAQVQAGLAMRSIAKLVRDIGDLCLEDVATHLTTAEAEELLSGETNLKYRTILQKDESGQNRVRFTTETQNPKLKFELLKKTGLDSNKTEYVVNPISLLKLKRKVIISADTITPRNENLEKMFKLEAYDRLINNPLIINDPKSLEQVTKDFLLKPLVGADTEKYLPGSLSNLISNVSPRQPQPVERLGLSGNTLRREGLSTSNMT